MINKKVSHQPAVGLACALSPAALTDRQSEWRTLTDQALSRKTGPGWVSSTYPATVLPTLHSLIEAEAECCPFLDFDVRRRGETLEVDLRFPPEFHPMVSAVLSTSHPTRGQ